MGKAARWLRSLFAGGGRRGSEEAKPKEKRRWGFGKPRPATGEREGTQRGACCGGEGGVGEPEKHAIAVAAATAAVAEAAMAAAQAAAAVVRLTSSGRCAFGAGAEEAAAAVRIQAAFRGYLARRAHRALKGLVKLQALVRGHIERKNVAEKLRCMQAIVRVQAHSRAIRLQKLDCYQPSKRSVAQPGPPTPEKHEVPIRSGSARQHDRSPSLKRNSSRSRKTSHLDMGRSQSSRNWLDQWMDERSWDYHEAAKIRVSDDDKTAKILEVDSGKPRHHAKRASRNLPQSSQSTVNSHSYSALPDSPSKDSTTVQFSNPSPSSVEMESLSPQQLPHEACDSAFLTADNSSQFYSASSKAGGTRRGPFTPTKSECSRSYLNGFSDYPGYMANTESSKAKVRSHSAPKQRSEYEKSTSLKPISIYGLGDGVSVTSGCSQKSTSLHAKFTNKAYPGSGRLDRLGMPVREVGGYSGTSRYRY